MVTSDYSKDVFETFDEVEKVFEITNLLNP